MKNYIQLRNELTVYIIYLQLMTSLIPKKYGGISNKTIRDSLIEASEFLKDADEVEMVNKGSILIEILQEAVDMYKKSFPLKVPLEQIIEEFNEFFIENKELYSWGLGYGWLQSVMDCSKMGFPKDLPFHARIGLGHHAGFDKVEEEFLLRDSFFMLALAEKAYNDMHEYAKHCKKANKPHNQEFIYKILATANQNVATYSRLSILSFFSFIEAFVNSVGYDFNLRNKDILSSKEIEILHGTRKRQYLSLEYKIEKFPSIIRSDKKTPIILSDPNQIRDPFKTIIKDIKEIRDASVHYSPRKEPIWRKPDDWLNKAKSTSKLCLEGGLEFWKACYPDRKEPQYLNGLDYNKHINIARKRLNLRDEIKNIKNNRIRL